MGGLSLVTPQNVTHMPTIGGAVQVSHSDPKILRPGRSNGQATVWFEVQWIMSFFMALWSLAVRHLCLKPKDLVFVEVFHSQVMPPSPYL